MSDPVELLEKRIQSLLTGEAGANGLHFFCQIGGTDDEEHGITTLQISGNGWALLSWRAEETADMYSYLLSAEELKKFYGVITEFPFWSANPKRRTRNGDEINVHVRISDQDAGTSNGIQFWSTDIADFPVLGRLLARIQKLNQVLSDDEVPSYF